MRPGYGAAPLGPARGRPDERRLPDGFVVRLDPRARRLDRAGGGGLALLGLSPGRLLHLAPAAQRMLAGDQLVVRDPASASLARRLLDAGVAHPVVPAGVTAVGPGEDGVTVVGPGEDEVTVVVPVRDRPDNLRALLAALAATAPGLAEVIVVDDGSTHPETHRAAVEQQGADSALASRVRLIRHPTARGPAAGRNAGLAAAATPLVAFLDSDVVPEPGWLAPLRAHLADPAVALAAPRVVALPVEASAAGWLDRYEGLRSSLDLGPHPALIAPRTRVAYVPSAALLVRRAALGAGFAEQLRVAEDVDLVLRLHAEGWRLRYEPGARVAHRHRTRAAAWWVRKAFYGTGAAPLALRHPRAVPPLVLAPWAAAVCLLVAVQRTLGWLGAVGVTASAWWRLRGTLGGLRRPNRVAVLLVGLGLVNAANQAAGLLLRHWWPVALPASVVSRRVRRAVLVAALGEGLLDWYRHRPAGSPADRQWVQPGLDPLRYLLAHRADDLGYGAGLWWGALHHRTLAPLRPQLTVDRRRPVTTDDRRSRHHR